MDILIIDGNNLAHKCKYSFNLTTPDGLDCSVTYGVLSVLRSYISKFDTTAVVMAWDGGIPKHRREAIQEYKANRTKSDDPFEYMDFVRQLEELDRILRKMGVLSVRQKWIEADDLMHHAAFMASPFYDRVVIISSDQDMLQSVNVSENVLVWDPNKEDIRDASWISKEYGIDSNDFLHWRALQGDGSDNIEGVKGIGPKTATKLFQEFESLAGIFNAAAGDNPRGEITGKVGDGINSFGFHRAVKNVFVMALLQDRAGARIALWRAVEHFQYFSKEDFHEYLFSNSFVSLMDGGFYNMLGNLECPQLDDEIRMPVVPQYRHPVEDVLDQE